MAVITPVKAVGSGVDASGDVTGTVTALKEFSAGDTIPPDHLGTGTPDATKVLKGDGSWGAASASVTQSSPIYLTSGGSTNITGKTVLAAYEQTAGATFTTPFTTRTSYVEQDATNGTDHSGGIFTLHSTSGVTQDSNTKLMLHADGSNNSTEIIDQRGITPFGSYCGYFDGTARYKVPSSYKNAFGAGAFTYEAWVRLTGAPSGNAAYWLDCRESGADSAAKIVLTYNFATSKFGYDIANGAAGGAASATSSLNAWHHVALVRSGSTVTLYVDGVSLASSTYSGSMVACPLSIGTAWDGGSAYGLIGWMSNIRVSKVARYTGAFTPPTTAFTRDADTVYLFKFDDGHGAQVLKDDSRSGAGDLYLNGVSISTAQAKFGSSSLRFPGGNNYLQTQANKYHADHAIGADDFTIDFWVRVDALSGLQTLFAGSSGGLNPVFGINASGQVELSVSSNGSTWNIANSLVVGTISAATWAHIALTRSGTNVYAFVNGVLGATLAVSTASIWQSTAYYSIGRSVATNYLTGYIDEFRVKRGVAEWTANFTPPTSAHTADDRTVLLLHFDGANGDKVTLDSSESSYGTDQFGDTTIPALTFAGSASLASTQTRGGHSTSLALNGTDQYASIAYAEPGTGHPLYFPSAGYLCIEGWFYVNTLASAQVILSSRSSASSSEFVIWVSSGSTYAQQNDSTFASGPATTVGWNHVALVKEPRGWAIYTNGVAGSVANPTTSLVYTANPRTLYIGRYPSGSGYFSGYVDAVRITNGKPRYTANFTPGNLTQDDDTALLWEFNGSVGQKWVKELSKNSAMIAATNARTVSDGVWIAPTSTPSKVSTAQSKFGGSSLYFDGTGQHALLSSFVPTGDYTVDFWIRVPFNNASNWFLANGTNGVNTNLGYQVFVDATGKMRFYQYYDTAGNAYGMTSNTTLPVDTWTHFAFVRNGTTVTMYQNGTQVATMSAANPLNSSANNLSLGRFSGVGDFTGYIDEFRLSNTARWTSGFTPPTTPYGTGYVTGPYWVATKPTVSSIDLSAYSSIDSVTFTTTIQPSTTLLYLISTDGYATPLKRWNGSAWVDTAYSMTWNGTTLTTTATASQLDAVANTATDISTGLLAMDVSAINSLNIVALLSSSNAGVTPTLDSIVIGTDAYTMIRPITDYAVTKKKASGTQTLTFTKVSAGNGNLVFDYVE